MYHKYLPPIKASIHQLVKEDSKIEKI